MNNKKNILVVEDNNTSLIYLSHLLDDADYNIFPAKNGEAALASVETHIPDLILLDIVMPGMSGFDVCKRIKQNKELAKIPIIFLTAITNKDEIIEGFRLGAVDYVTKPFQSEELLARVKTHLTLRENEIELNNINKELIIAKEKAEENFKRFNTIFNQAPLGIALIDSYIGYIYEVNDKFAEIAGRTTEQMININWMSITHPDDIQEDLDNMELLNGNKTQGFQMEKRYIKPDGSYVWINMTISPLKGTNIHTKRHLCMIEDISIRKQYEIEFLEKNEEINTKNQELSKAIEKIEKSEQNFSNIFNKSNDSIIISDFDGNIIHVNDIFCKIMGYTREGIVNTNVLRYTSEKFIKRREKIISELKEKKQIVFETENITKNGKLIPFEISSIEIQYYGKPAILSMGRNLTERNLTERKILNAIIDTEEKERTRIAQELHDGIGPLLSVVKLYAQWLAEPGDVDPKKLSTQLAETINEAIDSVKDISNNLSPHILMNYGLISAVQSFINRIKNTTITVFEFEDNLKDRLAQNIEITLYRIIIECINNTLKHAFASAIKIKILKSEKSFLITYSDNGIGFDINKISDNKKGHGLFNMQNRLKTIGATLKIISNKGTGTQIEIKIE